MSGGALGKLYRDGEEIVHEGEVGNCMYVIQTGRAVVVRTADDGQEEHLTTLEAGAGFGEMSIFQHEPRSATVRALGDAWVMTIDKRTFLGRVQEDPTLAFTTLQRLCDRVRSLSSEVVALREQLHHAGLKEDPR